jgi:hypothetical protein
MSIDLRLIAGGVGASVLLAHVQKQELVVSCPLGAIHATPRRWHKLRIAFVEWSEFEDEKNVRLNPEMQTANGEQDAFGLLASRAPILFEASGECLFLLGGLELRQQERMADANLLTIESIHGGLRQFGQAQPRGHIHRSLARLRGNLFDAVLRLLQIEESAEAVGFFHWVNVAALKVFNQLCLQHFGVGEVLDANGDGGDFGKLRGAVTPCAEDDLEATLTGRPHQQGRENALAADGCGQLVQGVLLEDAAGVGRGLGEHCKRKVAVLGGVGNGGGVHGDRLLSSGCNCMG